MNYSSLSDDGTSIFRSNIQTNAKVSVNVKLLYSACYGGIQPALDSDLFILGDVFAKSQLVVFDAGNESRLGLAANPL